MRPVNEIVIHCTATRPEWMAGRPLSDKVAEIRRWHMRDRGWADIGYHYLIDRDGQVATGRPVERVGAHVANRNTNTIGVSLLGGHGSATTDAFETNYTPEQDRALRTLLADLQRRFPAIRTISGHNWYAAKACPGFDVTKWLNRTQAPVVSRPVMPQPAPVSPVIRRGDRGPAVVELQRRLRIGADGVFGPQTDAAVRMFQTDNRLIVDGIVGPQTWGLLRSTRPFV
jgi:N-acetylmuramoyl-L-alanine amidase